MQRLLEDSKATTASAASVDEAMMLFHANGKFDVIVSDIGMPKRDGFDLIAIIRHLSPNRGGLAPYPD